MLNFAFIFNTNIVEYYIGAKVIDKSVEMDYIVYPNDQLNILKGDIPTEELLGFIFLRRHRNEQIDCIY